MMIDANRMNSLDTNKKTASITTSKAKASGRLDHFGTMSESLRESWSTSSRLHVLKIKSNISIRNVSIRTGATRRGSSRMKQPKENSNSYRSYLLIHKSKCYEIFTGAYVQAKEGSCQVSTPLDKILIDTNYVCIDHGSSRNFMGSIAWAHSRARRSLPKFERDICMERL